VQVGDADDLGGLGLFALADLDHLAPAHRGIVPTGVAARDEAVLHVDAFVGPHGDAPGDAEVDVVGVSDHHEDAFDVGVGEQGHTGDANGGC
jgi:hypothetical protein